LFDQKSFVDLKKEQNLKITTKSERGKHLPVLLGPGLKKSRIYLLQTKIISVFLLKENQKNRKRAVLLNFNEFAL
jgi:hypothetical protein